MSAQQMPKKDRRPAFTTEVYVDSYADVHIEPEELEKAGWVYVGKEAASGAGKETVLDTVRRWHDDNHDGPWQWCDHELCDSLRGRPHDGRDS